MGYTQLEPGPGALSEFYDWLKNAFHGDVVVYHVGDLQFDRQAEVDPLDPDAHRLSLEQMALNAVADAVMRAHRERQVSLTQKRLGPNHYEYRATRLRESRQPARKRFTRPNVDLVLA